MLPAVFEVSSVAGHLRNPAVRGERRIELRLDESPMALVYRVGFGAEVASQIRRRADSNGDGAVSAAEGNAFLDGWTRALQTELELCAGVEPSDTACSRPAASAIASAVAEGWTPAGPGHLHFEWKVRWDATALEVGAVRVKEAWEPGGIQITDVSIAAPLHSALRSAGVDDHAGVSTELTFIESRRAPGPRVLHAAWGPPASSWWQRAALVLGIAGAGALIALRVRRGPRRGAA